MNGPTFTPPPGDWDKPTSNAEPMPAPEATGAPAAHAAPPVTPEPAATPAAPPAAAPAASPTRPPGAVLASGDFAPSLARGVIAAALAAVAAIVLWLVLGWLSLLLDIVAAGLVALFYLEGWQQPTAIAFSDLARTLRLHGREYARPLAAVAGVPLVVGLLCGIVGTAHHTSQEDVCNAYQEFQSSGSSTDTFDNAWFDALTNVGKKAADYAGPDEDAVREAGKAAQKLADGDGQGMIVSVNVGEAESTLAPVASLCYGE